MGKGEGEEGRGRGEEGGNEKMENVKRNGVADEKFTPGRSDPAVPGPSTFHTASSAASTAWPPDNAASTLWSGCILSARRQAAHASYGRRMRRRMRTREDG